MKKLNNIQIINKNCNCFILSERLNLLLSRFSFSLIVMSVILFQVKALDAQTIPDNETIKTSIELSNQKKYKEAIEILKNVKENSNWRTWALYYMGINYYNLRDYPLSEKYFFTVSFTPDFPKIHLAYLNLAEAQYAQKKYEEALNSLEIAFDLTKEEKVIEEINLLVQLINRDIQFNERNKYKNTLVASFNLNFDSNLLDKNSYTEEYKGYTNTVSLFYAKKTHVEMTEVVEPSILILNNLNLDSEFKITDEFKSNDSTLLMFNLPKTRIYNKFTDTTSISLGGFFAPEDDADRRLAIGLLTLKKSYLYQFNEMYNLGWQINLGRDQSQLSYSDEEDEQTSIKLDSSVQAMIDWSNAINQKMNFEIGGIYNSASGDNAKYHKLYVNLSSEMQTPGSTITTLTYNYGYTDYFEHNEERLDKTYSYNVSIAKDAFEFLNIATQFQYFQKESNLDSLKFQDYIVGLQFNFLNQF